MRNLFIAGVLIWGFVAVACTDSPFSDDTVKVDRRTLTGQVKLSTEQSPANTFVWLAQQNLHAYADEAGTFSLTLPPPLEPGDNVVRYDTLYFYVANYHIEKVRVAIIGGQFQFGKEYLDDRGHLLAPVTLRPFINIQTDVTYLNREVSLDTILVSTTLTGIGGCVTVFNPLVNEINPRRNSDGSIDTLGAVVLRHVQTGRYYTYRSDPAGTNYESIIPCDWYPMIRELHLSRAALNLPPGEYEFIPFLLLEPPGVPERLLQRLGGNMNGLSDYHRKPMKRYGGFFTLN